MRASAEEVIEGKSRVVDEDIYPRPTDDAMMSDGVPTSPGKGHTQYAGHQASFYCCFPGPPTVSPLHRTDLLAGATFVPS